MEDGPKSSTITYQLATCVFIIEENNNLIEILLINFNIQSVLKFVKVKNKMYPIIIINKRYSTNNSHLIFRFNNTLYSKFNEI